MKRLRFILLSLTISISSISQVDTLKRKEGVEIGVQGGGQIVSAFEQNWVYYSSYHVLNPFYSIGVYIKRERHSLEINISNNKVLFTKIIPFIGYNYKFNKQSSKIDINASLRLYSYFLRYSGYGDKKFSTYSRDAFCYGISVAKKIKRLNVGVSLFNYFTFESYNNIYKNRSRTLPILFFRKLSADVILELKLRYRLTK